MKKLALISIVLLSGCFDNNSDIQEFIVDVQKNTTASITRNLVNIATVIMNYLQDYIKSLLKSF